MERSESQYAIAKLEQLKSEYQVEVLKDWGDDTNPTQQTGTWSKEELDRLHNSLDLLAGAMGGRENFIQNLNGVTVKKADIGSHGGEALAHQVTFPAKGSFSAWTVVHEFAHAWDANHGWRLSVALERYTGGFTSPFLSFVKRLIGFSDSGLHAPENKPGRRGRKPGCNKAGYFYGDKPSGSNWSFNRVEDFAESVTMYIAWERDNALSAHARGRVVRYQLQNGEKDFFNIPDYWADYAKYFYPENGDYTKTKRWKFVDELMNGKWGG